MKNFLIAANLLSALSLNAASIDKYYGDKSTEAILTFNSKADIKLRGNLSLEEINSNEDLKSKVLQEISNQVDFLMGSFQTQSFQEKFGHQAVLGEDFDIKIKSVKEGTSASRRLVNYRFKGKIVVDNRAFESQDIVSLPIVLPLAYDQIYKLGLNEEGVNLCTDEHYNSELDLFYFWDTAKKDCPLSDNNKDVVRGEGKLKILKNTIETYPEYHLLYKKDDGVLNISLFLGYIDDIEQYTVPKKTDNGYYALKEMTDYLKSKGFVLENKKEAFRLMASKKEKKGINFYRQFKKIVKTKIGNLLTIRVSLMLADTGINSQDLTFHSYLIPAMETDDIIVYDGHSGLGANLSLDYLGPINFDQNKYQLIFFNGCSSYPYFNMTYFDAKGGSKYLDIVTSGLPTITSTMAANLQAFISPFISGRIDSYQKIMKGLEKSNGEEGTYLTGVNGDEDNQFQP